MSKLKESFVMRDEENQLLDNTCPELMDAFGKVHGAVMKDGVLSRKNKSLMALGIAICVRCDGCMFSHVETAVLLGASMNEIAETVEVAILMGGGPSTVFGRRALKAAEELLS